MFTPEIRHSPTDHVLRGLKRARKFEAPFPHWIADNLFERRMQSHLKQLALAPPPLGGVSGTREIHNDSRTYLSGPRLDSDHRLRNVADIFQCSDTARLIQNLFGADLSDTYVRLEYCLDTRGFWLKPHTDLGVKRFTMLIYLSDDPRHSDLGTDLFLDENAHAGRVPFTPNSALIFTPSKKTFHGFLPRVIDGVRRSLILNYVTTEWKASEQLAYPGHPVLASKSTRVIAFPGKRI
ncbi:MAG: hypothetical protein VR74_06645 [Hyphomonas sp. BRH_c22]|uniref:2OG-Fe(II) oxygenase n=1 Tax=Hyphomonas TaxID=85 RepID=UPI0005F0DACC|nr:2OG-Fe(II) oxygenase [Hyphomonas sp. BRH_c22]KJS38048.1 MAG: hypothetical protein VR74_06645 [Hyphomonas sp. BRH_c22]